jgi:predicted nuclease with TOPRIM domain
MYEEAKQAQLFSIKETLKSLSSQIEERFKKLEESNKQLKLEFEGLKSQLQLLERHFSNLTG